MKDCLGDVAGSGEGARGIIEGSTEEKHCRWIVLGEPETGSWGAWLVVGPPLGRSLGRTWRAGGYPPNTLLSPQVVLWVEW